VIGNSQIVDIATATFGLDFDISTSEFEIKA